MVKTLLCLDKEFDCTIADGKYYFKTPFISDVTTVKLLQVEIENEVSCLSLGGKYIDLYTENELDHYWKRLEFTNTCVTLNDLSEYLRDKYKTIMTTHIYGGPNKKNLYLYFTHNVTQIGFSDNTMAHVMGYDIFRENMIVDTSCEFSESGFVKTFKYRLIPPSSSIIDEEHYFLMCVDELQPVLKNSDGSQAFARFQINEFNTINTYVQVNNMMSERCFTSVQKSPIDLSTLTISFQYRDKTMLRPLLHFSCMLEVETRTSGKESSTSVLTRTNN